MQTTVQSASPAYPYRLTSSGRDGDGQQAKPPPTPEPANGEDLPYKVEVWDLEKTSVEQTLAITANASIGYAAYYEATKEYPHRFVTLRHKNRTVARWNPPGH